MRRLEIVLFVIGLSVIAYLYGVASTRKEWFPYAIVEDGWSAARALKEVWDSEGDLPPGAIELADAEPIHRRPSEVAQTAAPNPPDDLLLITGGPFMLMDFCPELGCLAWLMDRSGTIYHTWAIDPKVEWGETLSGFPRPENINPVGAHVYGKGDLLVTFQGRNTFPFSIGIAKFDKDGKLLWKHELNAHHWFDIGDDGLIYVAAHRLFDSPLDLGTGDHRLICKEDKIYEDFIIILDPDGRVLEEFSLLNVYIESGYAALLERSRAECDRLHLNDVRILRAKDVEAYPGFAAGDLLVSTNSVNAVAILDRDSRRIKWLTSGTMMFQHNPRFAGDNRILVFDNQGGTRIEGQGGSRIIEIDVPSQRVRTIFPKSDSPRSLDFYTRIAGHFDLDRARSRALVSLSLQGRLLEVDLETGEVLWEYANVHDVGDYLASNGDDASLPYALFGLHSAYYVGRPGFLE
jgi:Arylsulfotransferase (ASST)